MIKVQEDKFDEEGIHPPDMYQGKEISDILFFIN